MKVTERTRAALRQRRAVKKLLADGYEEVGERGGSLWEIHRGFRTGQKILDAVIPPNGMSVFVKIGKGI